MGRGKGSRGRTGDGDHVRNEGSVEEGREFFEDGNNDEIQTICERASERQCEGDTRERGERTFPLPRRVEMPMMHDELVRVAQTVVERVDEDKVVLWDRADERTTLVGDGPFGRVRVVINVCESRGVSSLKKEEA